MKFMRMLLAVVFAVVAFPLLAAEEVIVLQGARLIDGTGAAAIEQGVIVIQGEKILAVGRKSAGAIPPGARVIDLGDVTLLPGLIDTHVHLTGRTLADPKSDASDVKDLPSLSAIIGVANARKTLLAGFTSVRNLGSGNFDDLALKQAIDEQLIEGPRIQGAGYALGMTGGHCDSNGWRPGLLEASYKEGVVDSTDDARRAVRYQAKYGAEVIKTCATGGVLSEGDAVGVTQLTYEEMKAIVDEATKLDRKVAAHAHGAEGIKIATRAGVASIEHGSFLDEEGAKLMASRGTYLVPTLMAVKTVVAAADSGRLTGLRANKARAAGTAARNALKIAIRNGVPIAFGTDENVYTPGDNAGEFALMVEWGGMKPMDAIVSATSSAAKLMGWDGEVGTLQPGKASDVIAVKGDPLANIRAMEQVTFVMKGGIIYKDERRGPGGS